MALTKTPSDPVATQPVYDPNLPPPDFERPPPDVDTTPPLTAPNIPDPDADPDKAWMNYGVQAINILYPHARNGVDFAWGRTEVGGDASLLDWSDKLAPPDEAKIEEVARGLAEKNPYLNYQPQPSLAAGTIRNAPDEVPPRTSY